MLDWKNNTYEFVAEEEVYEITGSFERSLDMTPSDGGRWDWNNQAHGVLSTYYPNNNDSWWMAFNGNYQSLTVRVKNYLPIEETVDNFMVYIRVTMDNGRVFTFRVYTDKNGSYAYSRAGIQNDGDAKADWSNWRNLSHLNSVISGEGTNFKVERTAANVLTLSVNGEVVDTYTMTGVTGENNVKSIDVKHQGNKGQYVDIPFEVKEQTDKYATVHVATLENGTVTTDKDSYKEGEKVTLTITPAEGYSQKLYVNGKTLMLGWNTNTYSFDATEESYKITGSFEPNLNIVPADGRWDTRNQAHGVLNAYYPSNDDSWLMNFNGNYQSLTVKAKNYLSVEESKDGDGKTGFAVVLRVTMDNGKIYAFRVINDKGTYAFDKYGAASSQTGWGDWKNINHLASKFNGEGVDFSIERSGADTLLLSVDGVVVYTYQMTGVTADNEVSSFAVIHTGNKGQHVEVPFVLTEPSEEPLVEITIPTLENGTVSTDKDSYKVGEKVTLTITPAAGYSQKLYVNGKALMLGWNTNTYSFDATEESYKITGSFEPNLNIVPADGRWDTRNQAHGVLNAYYPSNDDSWLMNFNGNYQSLTVKAKNYLSVEESKDGDGKTGFAVVLRVTMDNGKIYAFRVINDKGTYAFDKYGAASSQTGWGDWKNINHLASKFNGEGVDFSIERSGADTLLLSVDGVVVYTYQMTGVTADNEVSSFAVIHTGNKGQHVEVPFEVQEIDIETGYKFDTNEISKYQIVYDGDNTDYRTSANQLADQIYAQYGIRLNVASDAEAKLSKYEILLGDTNRYIAQGRIMEYSVTVDKGKFRINVGGSYSAEKAIAYLCENVFNGQERSLDNGTYYSSSLLSSFDEISSGTTARVMSANLLADSFADGSQKNANYRAELFAGMLLAYTPDVIGLQETDNNWNVILDAYLAKIQNVYGIQYERHLATYDDKLNYTSLLYRADKFKVENSGVKVFTWWTDSAFSHNYHMRNITWAQFSTLENPDKKFVVANTHWSYRTEHADGNIYLTGASSPIATNELRMQCMNETKAFMEELKETYTDGPVFLTGDFNTSLPFFTQDGWTPTDYEVISEAAKNNGTSLTTVPESGHFDHLFGTGNYTIKRYNFFNNVNQHNLLSDHPFVYADLAF